MYPDSVFLIVTFFTSHAAIRAERDLKALGLKVELIPVPREISSACGFCLLVPASYTGLNEAAGAQAPQEAVRSATEASREGLWLATETGGSNLRKKEKRYERLS